MMPPFACGAWRCSFLPATGSVVLGQVDAVSLCFAAGLAVATGVGPGLGLHVASAWRCLLPPPLARLAVGERISGARVR